MTYFHALVDRGGLSKAAAIYFLVPESVCVRACVLVVERRTVARGVASVHACVRACVRACVLVVER